MPASSGRLVAMIVVACFVAAGCAISQKTPPASPREKGESPESMIASAKAVDAAFLAAFNQRDADAAAAVYWNSPDLVVYLPGEMECRGWQATHDALARILQNIGPGCRLEMIDPQYFVAGPCVIGYGRWKLTQPDGSATLGRFTAVTAKKDGKWVYVLDHPSQPVP